MCRNFEGKREISVAELKSHNTPSSAWTVVNDKVIDISEFSKRHPGGDIILLTAGKDGTVLFRTYHPKGVPQTLLNKLEIGSIKDVAGSYYDWSSPFYATLCERVVRHLASIGRPLRGNSDIQVKALCILVTFWFSLVKMYKSDFPAAIFYSIVMGFSAHFIGTCIQHDGNHGAFSKRPLINTIAGWTMDMIGASAFTWQFQHMLGHHPYTNLLDVREEELKARGEESTKEDIDQESDPDVFSSFPLMRMHPAHEPSWINQYQHMYAPILFALMTLAKVFQQDVQVALSHKLYHIDAKCRYGSTWNLIRFWGMKILSICYMIGLPCYFHGPKNGLILFTIGHLTCGEVLATMFIVNHVIEGVAFVQKNTGSGDGKRSKPMTQQGVSPMDEIRRNRKIDSTQIPDNDWAAVQCQTSVNWSAGSWFWNHFSGGLSHQIEHHLFPSVCHTNYVYIHDIVKQTCEEFGVPYQSEPNLFVAYKKMLNHLKIMGRMKRL